MCYLKIMNSPVFRFVILVNLILDCVINCDAPPFPKLGKLRASHTHSSITPVFQLDRYRRGFVFRCLYSEC